VENFNGWFQEPLFQRVLPASVCEGFSAVWYRGLSAHELVEDSPWVRERPVPCPLAWRRPSGDSSVGGRPGRSPHASPGRCGPWRRGSPTRMGFPAPPRRCESTIAYSNSVSPTMLPSGVGLRRVPPDNTDHRSMVPGRCPPFSNWPLPRELAFAKVRWSWRIADDDPDHAADANPGGHRASRFSQRDRWVSTGLPRGAQAGFV